MRKEADFLGELSLPNEAYYGIHSLRAQSNFAVSSLKPDKYLIKAIGFVKQACAITNYELGYLSAARALPVIEAAQAVANNLHDDAFIVDPLQGGAGTSWNMNANEVIANLALQKMGQPLGNYDLIDPLRDVNLHQSTNDVFPTAVKVATLLYLKDLEKSLTLLQEELQAKELEFKEIVKLGRTQLMDAVPMTLGQEFSAFAEAFARDRWRIFKARERIKTVNLGGTAIGTGLNAPRDYIFRVTDKLRQLTGLNISRSENLIDATANQDAFVEVMGMLKAVAVNLFKVANDLRFLSSGPKGGLQEICLPAKQAGSSIMPGKVNPVIPELIMQVALKVQANDFLVTQTAMLGQLQINQFMPLLAQSLLESLQILNTACRIFAEKCVRGITANRQVCLQHVKNSNVLATVLVPKFGYERVASWIHSAREQECSVEEIILASGEIDATTLQEMLMPSQMYKLGHTYKVEA